MIHDVFTIVASPFTSVSSFGVAPVPIFPLVLAITISSVAADRKKMPSAFVFLSLLVVIEV